MLGFCDIMSSGGKERRKSNLFFTMGLTLLWKDKKKKATNFSSLPFFLHPHPSPPPLAPLCSLTRRSSHHVRACPCRAQFRGMSALSHSLSFFLQGFLCWWGGGTGPAEPRAEGSVDPSVVGLSKHVEIGLHRVCGDGLFVQRVGRLRDNKTSS